MEFIVKQYTTFWCTFLVGFYKKYAKNRLKPYYCSSVKQLERTKAVTPMFGVFVILKEKISFNMFT